MVYLTRYEEYPIYEPAEGGYYYSGNQVVEYQKLSKRQARKKMDEIWKQIQEENKNWEDELKRWTYSKTSYGVKIRYNSYYIGDGTSYVIERNLGSEERGWKPYC